MPIEPEILAELERHLEKIHSRGFAVVVEGKKDKAALESAGISTGRIFVLSRKPIFAVAEEVAANHKEAAILTDLDSEGKKLYGRLNTQLQRLGVAINNDFRNFLFRKTKLRQVEGLSSIIQHV